MHNRNFIILWLSLLVGVCIVIRPHPAIVGMLLVLGFLLHWFGIFKSLKPQKANAPLILESISASHFVEKVRWSLDLLGIPYREKAQIGIFGIFFKGQTVPRLWVPTGIGYSQIGNSAEILRYLWGRYAAELGESAQFLHPTLEALAWEQDLDRFGVQLQSWFYSAVIHQPGFTRRLWGQKDPNVPKWQRLCLPICRPLFTIFLRRAFRINQRSHAKAQEQIEKVLARVEHQLRDGRRYLLNTEGPSFVDITFAALSGIWTFPEGYGNGRADAVIPTPENIPKKLGESMKELKERFPTCVAFVQRMYRDHRKLPLNM